MSLPSSVMIFQRQDPPQKPPASHQENQPEPITVSRSISQLRSLLRLFGLVPKVAGPHQEVVSLSPIQLMVYSYLSVRYMGVIIIQAARLAQDPSRNKAGIWLSLSKIKCITRLESFERFWGNPWSSFPSLSFSIYGCALVSLTFIIILRPFIDRHYRLDGSSVRFLFEPEQEIRRYHRLAASRVARLAPNQLVYPHWRCKGPHSPALLHQNLMATSKWTVLIMVIMAICINIILFCYIPYLSWQLNCIEMIGRRKESTGQQASCTPSPIDWLALAEMSLGFTIIEIFVMIYYLICALTLAGQFRAIGQLSVQLKQLIAYLELTNLMAEVARLSPDKRQQDSLQLDRWLLSSWVKLSLCTEEHRRNARLLGHLLSTLLTISFMVFLSFFDTLVHLGPHLTYFWYGLLAIPWLGFNGTIIVTSYLYARTITLEPLAWSLVAQLSKRTLVMPPSSFTMGAYQLTKVSDGMWRRLAHSNSLSSSRLVVAPYGIGLTYRRLLQVNFLIVTLVTLR